MDVIVYLVLSAESYFTASSLHEIMPVSDEEDLHADRGEQVLIYICMN